jgi:hypothetical protein
VRLCHRNVTRQSSELWKRVDLIIPASYNGVAFSAPSEAEEKRMSIEIRDQILEQLQSLPYPAQRQVLDFVHALALSVPKGIDGKQLIEFAGAIPEEDLRIMTAAIEAGCERIDQSEW